MIISEFSLMDMAIKCFGGEVTSVGDILALSCYLKESFRFNALSVLKALSALLVLLHGQ